MSELPASFLTNEEAAILLLALRAVVICADQFSAVELSEKTKEEAFDKMSDDMYDLAQIVGALVSLPGVQDQLEGISSGEISLNLDSGE
jgi:hypothetical protein